MFYQWLINVVDSYLFAILCTLSIINVARDQNQSRLNMQLDTVAADYLELRATA